MEKIKTLLVVFAVCLPGVCFAQVGKFEDDLLTSQQRASERYILNSAIQQQASDNVANAAFIRMEGDNNTFIGNQNNTGSNRNPNIIAVMQSGNLNNINLDQNGEGNQTAVNQFGTGNDYEGRVNGRNNQAVIDQQGNFNRINQNVAGDDMNYRLSQNGNNNQINQFENGTQNKGYEVIQQGSGLSVTITNGF